MEDASGCAAEDHDVARTFLRHVSDVVTVIGADGEILYESPSVERVLGYRPEELVGENVKAMLHPDDLKRASEGLERFVASSGFTAPVVLRWRRRDGSWSWLESVGNRLPDDPDSGAILAVSRDVTEREMRDRSVDLSRFADFPAATFHTSPDPDGPMGFRFDYVGPESEEMLGYAPEEFYENPALGYEIVHPEDRDKVIAIYRSGEDISSRETRRSLAFECRAITVSGEERWVRVQASVGDHGPGGRSVRGVISDITRLRREEERAFEGERRYGNAFENASCGLALTGLDLGLLQVNDALCEMLGYTKDELLGRRMAEITHPDDVAASEDRIRLLMSGAQSSMRLEKRYIRRDGTPVWTISDSSLVRDADGEPSFFVISYQDITEYKELERKLRQSEERFRALVHKSSEMVKVVDLDGTLLYASPALKTVLGYDPAEVIGRMNVLDYVHPDDREKVSIQTADALARHEEDPESEIYNVVEYRFLHADGTWRRVESVGTYLLDHPAIEGVVINTRDVTERHEANARMRESEERHRRIVETVRAIIFECDHEGRFIYLNPAWERLMGYSVEETVGHFPEEFVVEEEPGPEEIVTEINGSAQEITLRTKQGRLRTFEVSFAVAPGSHPEADGDHGYAEAYGSLHDITERKDLERELERQALHDSLTDLPNRRFFMRQLEDALEGPGRGEVALLFVDIDDFKNINDTMGHEVGDMVLRAAAGRISNSVRAEDVVARLGGEEFVVLMHDVDLGVASTVAGRILDGFEPVFSTGVNCNEAEIEVGISVGVTMSDPGDPNQSASQLLHEADLAMYRAKESGGSCWRS